MDFYHVVEKRRTIREFADTAVPKGKLDRVLAAGLKAPINNHLREWSFILIKDHAVRLEMAQAEKLPEQCNHAELRRTFDNHDPIARKMYLDAIPKQKRMLLAAPELLVIAYKPKTQIADSQRVYDLNCFASIWCCIENILLAMAAEDIFGVTYIPQNTDAIKTVLEVPQEWEIAALIPLGYRAQDAQVLPQKKIELWEKLSIDQWREGDPWDFEEQTGLTLMQLL